MSAASIRHARAQDAPAILAMEAHFPSDRMSARSVRRFLRVSSAQVWMVEIEGAVAGSLVLLTPRGRRNARIYSVIVLPQMRGRGLAQTLVAHAEAQARQQKFDAITLEVRADNTTARALYRKRGYLEAQALSGFYDDGADGLRLRKSL